MDENLRFPKDVKDNHSYKHAKKRDAELIEDAQAALTLCEHLAPTHSESNSHNYLFNDAHEMWEAA